MANRDKMFQVIVLGGMALVPPLASAACGGAVASVPNTEHADSGVVDSGFPHEGKAQFDSGFPQEGPALRDSGFPQEADPRPPPDSGFPQEGPAMLDSGFPQETAQWIDSGFPQEGLVGDSGTMIDSGFPQEGPPPLDSGSGFPNETGLPHDGGGHDQ